MNFQNAFKSKIGISWENYKIEANGYDISDAVNLTRSEFGQIIGYSIFEVNEITVMRSNSFLLF